MLALLLACALAAGPSAEDLLQLARTSDLTVSPDRGRIAFSESRWVRDPEAKPGDDHEDGGWRRSHALRVLDLKSGELRTLSADDTVGLGAPQWSPDGRWLGYTRGDEGLHLLPVAGGEPVRVDLGELHPGGWGWVGPDTIAFVSTPPRTEEEKAERWARGGTWRFEHDWRNDRLYTAKVGPTGLDGEPTAITDGTDHVLDWRGSAAGWLLAVAPSADPYLGLVDAQVVLQREGSRTVLAEDPDCVGDLAWSPDGSKLVFAVCEGTISIPNRVVVHTVGKDADVVLLDGLGATVDGLWWVDAKTVGLRLTDKTETRFLTAPAAGGPAKDSGWSGGVSWRNPLPGPKGEWLAQVSTPDRPGAIVRLDKRGEPTVVYDPNPQVADWSLGPMEVVRWTHPEGGELEGILVRPPGATGPTPLLVLPHGGPDSVSTLGFSGWARFFAGAGYAVFMPNYRGGTGYGVAHYAANRGRLGEIELMDIESGVDALIERGLADPDRLYYGGWSWGGFLTAWTIGHTNRYKAAMAGAAVVDVVSQYVTSDINHGVIADWEYRGRPWKELDRFDAADPSRFLVNAKTPTLVLHGDADTRVPFAQGLTLYRALDDLGVEAELWVYPGQGHGLSKATHELHRLTTWLQWLERHP